MSFFFILMADPQFGCYAALSNLDKVRVELLRRDGYKLQSTPKIVGIEREAELYEKAITEANHLGPDFVVICGDMVHNFDVPAQHNELMRITNKIRCDIPVYWVAGNHDVKNNLTPETLSVYRDRFGDDNYAFAHKGSRFIIINSCTCVDSSGIPGEWEAVLAFLERELREARATGSNHVLVISHHPLFIDRFHEIGSGDVVPDGKRGLLLEMFREYEVTANFAGHWHKNVYAQHGGIASVASGPVGYPLGHDPSGFRVVKVYDNRIEHEYYALDSVPDAVILDGPIASEHPRNKGPVCQLPDSG